MEPQSITANDLHRFVKAVKNSSLEVVGVIKKGRQFAFGILSSAEELCLDYDVTILPPKKYFLPVKAPLLKYKTNDVTSYQAVSDTTERVIIGIHPEDLAAIALLDKAHREGESDGFYLERRTRSILIGVNPTRANQYRFTDSMLKGEADGVADIMLTELDDGTYRVEVNSEKGQDLVTRYGAKLTEPANEVAGPAVPDELRLPLDRDQLPAFLEGKEKHPAWEKRAEKCFSCGSCVLVCPTCYCFDVNDELDLTLEAGERVRSWDGCTIENFATVAGDHNFREKAADRLRHRIFRKGKYLMERFNMAGCVGCGRCTRACVTSIANPVEIINDLK